MNIYFIRHAQSMGNKQRMFSGITDVELSNEGKASLDHVKAFFSDKDISKIYISPLKRCRQTAEIVFGEKPFVVDQGLIEINFGRWEGVTFKQVMEEYPELWDDYMENWRAFEFPEGDYIPAYQKKAAGEIKRLIENHKGDDFIVVSHNGFIKAAMSYILTGDIAFAYHLSVQNGQISQIVLEDNFAKLRLLNY